MILERPKEPKHKTRPKRLLHTVSRIALGAAFLFIMMIPGARSSQDFEDTATGRADTTEAVEVTTLKAEFNRTAAGRKLLDFAKDNDITFVVDSTLADRGNLAEYSPGASQVRLKPGLNAEELAIYGAHELRHGWQDKKLKYADVETTTYLSLNQRWALRRYLEADAAAFSAWFAADRMKNLDLSETDYASARQERDIARTLKAEFATADGLTQDEYREKALEVFLADLGGYNARHLKLAYDYTNDFGKLVIAALTAEAKNDHAEARELLTPILDRVARTPNAAAFEAYLRHMGGTSFDLKDKTSLQSSSVSAQKLLSDYPFRSSGSDAAIAETVELVLKLERLEHSHNFYLKGAKDSDARLRLAAAAKARNPLRISVGFR